MGLRVKGRSNFSAPTGPDGLCEFDQLPANEVGPLVLNATRVSHRVVDAHRNRAIDRLAPTGQSRVVRC